MFILIRYYKRFAKTLSHCVLLLFHLISFATNQYRFLILSLKPVPYLISSRHLIEDFSSLYYSTSWVQAILLHQPELPFYLLSVLGTSLSPYSPVQNSELDQPLLILKISLIQLLATLGHSTALSLSLKTLGHNNYMSLENPRIYIVTVNVGRSSYNQATNSSEIFKSWVIQIVIFWFIECL